ncbi:MAG: tryptophan synthase subunit alpha [Candidatus Methylacidiphilales bacterium]|nr:tryptophan synthase subunit alpha [Candidatus Methylacidiphilales bacterium]
MPTIFWGEKVPLTVNRIDRLFQNLSSRQSRAFVAYLVAGDPSPDLTPALVAALERAGTDVVELGVPFSDPLADGVVNQLGAQRALEAGTTVAGVFSIVEKIRASTQIPLVLFTYYNPVHHYGLDRFLADCERTGVDGILLLDLPPEEAGPEWNAHPGVRRISLIAPTTPEERIGKITAASSGFIYYVSREGVTGMQTSVSSSMEERVALIRRHTFLPVCVGFGISNPEQARQVARAAQGVVVGSAIVDRIASWRNEADLAARLEAFVQPLAAACHQP